MENYININQKQNEIIMKINEKAKQTDIMAELTKKLPKLKQLYKDDQTPITIIGKRLEEREAQEITEYIKQSIDVTITVDTNQVLGLHSIKRPYEKEIEISKTKFLRTSLRSGQKIEYDGSLVIMGDVNAGAEVIAEENIVVMGTLRGLAHAGAKGNKKAIITAGIIDSPQIRISNIVKEMEQLEAENYQNAYAYIKGTEIIVEE